MIVDNLFLDKLTPINPKLDATRQLGIDLGVPIISVVVAQFLQTLVAIKQPKRILEIGTGCGYSGMVMLQDMQKDIYLTTIEKNAELAEKAKQVLFEYKDTVLIVQGDCRSVVPELASSNEQFDMIFMDGPKSAYIELLPYFVKLLPQAGALVCDNVLFRGMIADTVQTKPSTMIRKMREFLLAINNPPLKSCVLPIGDGVSVSTKIF